MPDRAFPDLDEMIRQIEAKAAQLPDPLAVLIAQLKTIIASDADPYLLAGALVEGIATTIAAKLPPKRQGVVAVATVCLLRDRLKASGSI